MKILACDVSMKDLAVYDGESVRKVPNSAPSIRKLLTAHPEHAVVCEPTSRYHLDLVAKATELGRTVYLVNPKEARNFKDSLSFRAKTDPLDARYLYEYVARNKDLLRPFKPLEPEMVELYKLLRERSQAVEARTKLVLSFGKDLSQEKKAVIEALTKLVKALEKRMNELASGFESYEILKGIPGVGPLTACTLVYVLESRTFDSAASLVAFLGLDVRIRQSGVFKGQGKITKRGDRLLRYILCCAGWALLASKSGSNKKEQLVLQKRTFKERIVIAARKILRVAWKLFTTKQEFATERWKWA